MVSTGSGRRRGEENDGISQIEWVPRSQENAYLACKLILLKRSRADIQWLCNPQECKFGLSLKGDLRPIESDEYGNQTMLHHRHPVGRIEFAGYNMSTCDSNKSIEAKFAEAQTIATCIQDFTLRRINRMRALPPSKKKLEEIRRVVETIQYLNNNEPDTEEEWPRPPPVGFCSPDGFSLMLENVSKYPTVNSQLKASQEKAFKKLTPEERQAWVGLPVHSQWKNMRSAVAPPQIPGVDDALSQERARANISTLMSRYKKIRTVIPPFEQEYKLTSTSQKFSLKTKAATPNPRPQPLQLHSLPNSSSYKEHGVLCGDGKYGSHFIESESDEDYDEEDEEEVNNEDDDDDDDDDEEEEDDDDDDDECGYKKYEEGDHVYAHAKQKLQSCERQRPASVAKDYETDETPLHFLLHPHRAPRDLKAGGATLPYPSPMASSARYMMKNTR
jgi:hypothetical protein